MYLYQLERKTAIKLDNLCNDLFNNKEYDDKLNMKVSELDFFYLNNDFAKKDLLDMFSKILEGWGYRREEHYMRYNSLIPTRGYDYAGLYISIGDFRKIRRGELIKEKLIKIFYKSYYNESELNNSIFKLRSRGNNNNVIFNEIYLKGIIELLESKGFKREEHCKDYDSLKNINSNIRSNKFNTGRITMIRKEDAYVSSLISIADFKKIYDGDILKKNQLKANQLAKQLANQLKANQLANQLKTNQLEKQLANQLKANQPKKKSWFSFPSKS